MTKAERHKLYKMDNKKLLKMIWQTQIEPSSSGLGLNQRRFLAGELVYKAGK